MEENIKKIFKAKIVSIENVARDVRKITFSINNDFPYSVGQYIWLEIPKLIAVDLTGNRRAFSICNLPNKENIISIIARYSESGYKKTLFSLKIGDEVNIHGPFGSAFVLSLRMPKNIIMIAGGTGISPFIPNIENLKKEFPLIPCFLVFLNKSQEDAPLFRELEEFKKNNNLFDYKSSYSYFSWEDIKDFYEKHKAEEIKWLISGPKAMVDFVYGELKKYNISDEDMIFENFYPTPKYNLSFERIANQLKTEGVLLQAIQNSTNHTIITDANAVILFANKAAEEMTGYKESELIGKTPRVWGGLGSHEFYINFWKNKKSGISFSGEVTNRRKNGEFYNVIYHISQIMDENKNIIGYIGTEEDITQEKNQIIELKKNKVKDDSILSSIGDGVIFANKDGIIEIVNPIAEKMFGYKSSEIIGKSVLDILSFKDEKGQIIAKEKRPVAISLSTKKIARGVYGYAPKEEIKFFVSITSAPVILYDELIGIIDVFRDVTKEREVDKAKTEFVSLASHQLKTPVNAIRWYAEMLLDNKLGKLSEKQRSYVDVIYKSNQRMITLIEDLLNVSRIDLGKILVKKEIIDTKLLLKDVIKEQKSSIIKKKHTVIVKQPKGELKISADPILLRQIMQNLISNAIKYTPDKGKIVCSIKKEGNKFLFSVKDNGIGIPKQDQKRIFEKLFRASNSAIFDSEGTGLGLYTARNLSAIMKGKIWFESEQKKGTTFYLEMPINIKK